MPFTLSLFRAAEGLGPLTGWAHEHRQPLGRRDEVKAALDRVLRGLRWTESDGLVFASGPFNGEEQACEITLFGRPDDVLLDVVVYAGPPAVRSIMSGLGLNYCHAQASGELYFPFEAGDHWPDAGR
ncbi:hypothetical protein [Ramlibacter pallidus]|uniref:Uncharacterized protein n=1 Tax=Ramlibacter pallidus TaxID=2780087 RepID=A0ABR9S5A3_9BURK|nr:hypothetical protein [Ramlibacter pallidus]MBE7368697.1 hypothetical protein [Ramlibacter pallidus]